MTYLREEIAMGGKEFLMELFDANFNRFLVLPIIKILYILGLVATTAFAGLVVVAGLTGVSLVDEPWLKILGPVLIITVGGVVYLLGALLSRLACETLLVGYRVAENTAKLVTQGEGLPLDRSEAARSASVRPSAPAAA